MTTSTPIVNAPIVNERYLDVMQVASVLHVGRTKAYRMMKQNEIAHVRVGKTIRVEPAALVAYIEAHTSKVA